MNKLNQIVWVGLLLSWSSCNRYTDQQPTPDSGPPASTIQSLTQRYPQAQNILFSTVVPNQLWQATFIQQSQRHRALTAPAQLLTAEALVDGQLPDSLARTLDTTVVAGGTFKNLRFRQWEYGWSGIRSNDQAYLYADYTWQQQSYTIYWSIARPAGVKPYYNLNLVPFQQAAYRTVELTDIPESLQATLRQQNLTFSSANIEVDALGKRRYLVYVDQQLTPLIKQSWLLSSDDSGQLLAATNNGTAQLFRELDQLPPAVQEYLRRPELAGFDLGRRGGDADSYRRHTFGSLTTYTVTVEKGKQSWYMTFSDKGQLISRSFLLYGSF